MRSTGLCREIKKSIMLTSVIIFSTGLCREIKKSIMFMTINFQIKPHLCSQLHTNWQLLF